MKHESVWYSLIKAILLVMGAVGSNVAASALLTQAHEFLRATGHRPFSDECLRGTARRGGRTSSPRAVKALRFAPARCRGRLRRP